MRTAHLAVVLPAIRSRPGRGGWWARQVTECQAVGRAPPRWPTSFATLLTTRQLAARSLRSRCGPEFLPSAPPTLFRGLLPVSRLHESRRERTGQEGTEIPAVDN